MSAALDLLIFVTVFFVMIVVGMELRLDDFRRVARYPKAVLGGTAAQLLLLPGLAAAMVSGLELSPATVGGLVLLAACPGGGISNVFTYLAGANVALSVTLTAVASLAAVVTLPLLVGIGLRLAVPGDAEVQVPIAQMIGQLVAVVLVPAGIGMAINERASDFADRHRRRLSRIGGTMILIVVALIFARDWERFGEALASGAATAAAWSLGSLALGWGVGLGLGLSPSDRFALVFEFGNRNLAVATVVALSSLQRPEFMALPTAVVATVMPLSLALALLRRRRARPTGAPARSREG